MKHLSKATDIASPFLSKIDKINYAITFNPSMTVIEKRRRYHLYERWPFDVGWLTNSELIRDFSILAKMEKTNRKLGKSVLTRVLKD